MIIDLPNLGKMSFQIRLRINCIMKNKIPYCNIRFTFQTKCKISNFFRFKEKSSSFLHYGSVMIAVLPIMAKQISFKVRMCKHLKISALNGKKLPLPLKNIFYFVTTHLILKISPFLLSTTTILKLTSVINRDHTPFLFERAIFTIGNFW